jgi:methylated-DNA-[protein]-cysteine S-methyltransferase
MNSEIKSSEESIVYYRNIASPVGRLLLGGQPGVLEMIGFPEGKGIIYPAYNWIQDDSVFNEVEDQLNEYFEGERQQFDLKIKPSGTPFQLSVLETLQEIPYGKTTTYRTVAERIGRPKAFRAVGAANGRNPLPIIIPCHRVIGANGSLTGFGGGLPTKSFLLNLESADFSLACR